MPYLESKDDVAEFKPPYGIEESLEGTNANKDTADKGDSCSFISDELPVADVMKSMLLIKANNQSPKGVEFSNKLAMFIKELPEEFQEFKDMIDTGNQADSSLFKTPEKPQPMTLRARKKQNLSVEYLEEKNNSSRIESNNKEVL